MNIAPYIRTAKSVITANSPVLLLGTTVAGVATTGVLAAKAGYKARGLVDEAEGRYKEFEDEEFGELTVQEKAQLTWLTYATAALSAAGTIAAAVGTHTVHTKRANAMAALYAVTSNKLDDMTERAEELLGPKKTQQLKDEIAQRQVDRDGPVEDSEVINIDGGTELCRDEWTKRWFMSSMPKIESAVNEINRNILQHGDASLNMFYDLIGLEGVPMGDTFGWSGKTIEARYGGVMTSDGKSAISVSFLRAPQDGLGLLGE